MSDQEPVAVAILAALNAVADLDAFDKDEVPGTLGNPGDKPVRHVVIELARRSPDRRRFGGPESLSGYVLNVTYRADTLTNCRSLRRLVCAELEDQEVGGFGPLAFNDETQPIDDDPDWGWSGIDTFAFC